MYDTFLAYALVPTDCFGFLNTTLGYIQTVSNLIAWSLSGFLDVPSQSVLIVSYILMAATAGYSLAFAKRAGAALGAAGGACD